jgi:hypothetical protein
MTDSYVQVEADSTGKKIDTEELAGGTHRERMVLAGTTLAATAPVTNSDPSTSAYGLPTRSVAPVPAMVATGTLAALNATVTVEVLGRSFVGASLIGSLTFVGSLIMEESHDNGTTWDERLFNDGDNLVTGYIGPHATEDTRVFSFPVNPSDTHVRIKVLTYTSGSLAVRLVANNQFDWQLFLQPNVNIGPSVFDSLNDTLEVPVYRNSVGFILEGGTFAGTVVVEAGPNQSGVVTWEAIAFVSGVTWYTSLVLTNPNAQYFISVPVKPAYSRVRIRVSAYTAGTMNVQGRTGVATDSSVDFTSRLSQTGTRTQVADSASDGILLAANVLRIGATVFNDSSAILYLGLGTTATTTTNYTVKIAQNGYYEVPARYTGQIRGIWATDPGDGAARVTELT